MNKISSLSCILSCCILAAGMLNSCDHPYEQKEPKFSNIMDLDDQRFRLGLPLGAKAMHIGEARFSTARLSYYANNHAAYNALMQNKIDGYLYDSHALDYVAANSPDVAVLPGSVGKVDIAIGIAPKNKDMLAAINNFIDQYKKDGTYEAMYERWVNPPGLKDGEISDATDIPEMPQIATPAEPTRKLVVGTSSEAEPMCFSIPGSEKGTTTLTGFDMELLRRLALHLNVQVELREMDYVGLTNGLISGELDLVIAGLNKTEEREKRNIIFSKSYIDSNIVVLVRSEQVAKQEK